MINKDSISAIVILAVCGVFWSATSHLSEMGAFFPRIIIKILVGFSLILLVQSFLKKNIAPAFAGLEARKLLFTVLGIVAYIVAMIAVGFVIASILFLMVLFVFLDGTKKTGYIKAAVVAVGVTGVFYGVFHYAFLVPLPVGLIFGG